MELNINGPELSTTPLDAAREMFAVGVDMIINLLREQPRGAVLVAALLADDLQAWRDEALESFGKLSDK